MRLLLFLIPGPTPCGAPVLAIHSGLPYCAAHIDQKDRSASSSSTAVNGSEPLSPNSGVNQLGQGSSSGSSSKSVRRKSRSRSTSSLGRHSRRLRNRRRAKRIGGSGETRYYFLFINLIKIGMV